MYFYFFFFFPDSSEEAVAIFLELPIENKPLDELPGFFPFEVESVLDPDLDTDLSPAGIALAFSIPIFGTADFLAGGGIDCISDGAISNFDMSDTNLETDSELETEL
jgi:hypothetical protein